MRRIKIGIALICLSLLCVSCEGSGASAQPSFTLASLRGSYASGFTGAVPEGVQLVPISGTGVFVADGAGNLSGHETYTVGTSSPCAATIKGTYTVSSDGSGTNTVTFTTSTPGCSGGSYTQSFAIGSSNQLVLLSNTNGEQINEEWHLQ